MEPPGTVRLAEDYDRRTHRPMKTGSRRGCSDLPSSCWNPSSIRVFRTGYCDDELPREQDQLIDRADRTMFRTRLIRNRLPWLPIEVALYPSVYNNWGSNFKWLAQSV